jgi:hypothetical protein
MHDFAMICTIVETLVAPRLSDAQATKLKQLAKTCRSFLINMMCLCEDNMVLADVASRTHVSKRGKLFKEGA